MLHFKPFFIQFPCCGYHDHSMFHGIASYPIHEANVLVLSGTMTHSSWALLKEAFAKMARPCWLMCLGVPMASLYDEAFVLRQNLKPHVCIQTCPVTEAIVSEGFQKLAAYVKKNTR